jgi:creatinine amidohydrolase
MTSLEFSDAVRACGGVCIIPFGCLERHGDHLPLGTDTFLARELVKRAVVNEPAVIFPPDFFGWIHDGKHRPGALALNSDLLMGLLDNSCEEIARNGMRKIIILNAHGGNNSFLNYFISMQQEKKRSFQVYLLNISYWFPNPEEKANLVDRTCGGHADEFETCMMLASRPELVHMDTIKAVTEPLDSLNHLQSMTIAWGWFSRWPDHMSGDPTLASVAKGENIMDFVIPKIAAAIKTIREDETMEKIQQDYFRQSESLFNP